MKCPICEKPLPKAEIGMIWMCKRCGRSYFAIDVTDEISVIRWAARRVRRIERARNRPGIPEGSKEQP